MNSECQGVLAIGAFANRMMIACCPILFWFDNIQYPVDAKHDVSKFVRDVPYTLSSGKFDMRCKLHPLVLLEHERSTFTWFAVDLL